MERDRNISAGTDAGPESHICTAVVPFDQVRAARDATSGAIRPGAAFVAQLIAANENMPQFRAFRRNDPGTASAAYETTNTRLQQRAAPMLHASVSLKII